MRVFHRSPQGFWSTLRPQRQWVESELVDRLGARATRPETTMLLPPKEVRQVDVRRETSVDCGPSSNGAAEAKEEVGVIYTCKFPGCTRQYASTDGARGATPAAWHVLRRCRSASGQPMLLGALRCSRAGEACFAARPVGLCSVFARRPLTSASAPCPQGCASTAARATPSGSARSMLRKRH